MKSIAALALTLAACMDEQSALQVEADEQALTQTGQYLCLGTVQLQSIAPPGQVIYGSNQAAWTISVLPSGRVDINAKMVLSWNGNPQVTLNNNGQLLGTVPAPFYVGAADVYRPGPPTPTSIGRWYISTVDLGGTGRFYYHDTETPQVDTWFTVPCRKL